MGDFATDCLKFIEDTSKRSKEAPASAQDISSLAALMLSMYHSLAPLKEYVAKIPQMEEDIKLIKEDVLELKNVVRHVVKNCNSLARHSYDYNVLIHAIPESDDESCDTLRKSAISLLSNSSAKPKSADIEVVHRLGKPKPGKARPVVVKFFNRNVKRRVITEFNYKTDEAKKIETDASAASKIRSQVTNHYPWRKLMNVDLLFTRFDAEEAMKVRHPDDDETVKPPLRKVPKGRDGLGRGWWHQGHNKRNANNKDSDSSAAS